MPEQSMRSEYRTGKGKHWVHRLSEHLLSTYCIPGLPWCSSDVQILPAMQVTRVGPELGTSPGGHEQPQYSLENFMDRGIWRVICPWGHKGRTG